MLLPVVAEGRESAGARSGPGRLEVAQASNASGGRDLRRSRLLGREVLQGFTSLDRLRFCGMPAGQSVRLRAGDGAAGVAGLASCGSVWACPCCSAKIGRERADDLERAIRTWVDPAYRRITARQGSGAFVLVTLTMRHHAGQSLASLWDGLSAAWRHLVSSRAYKTTTKGLGVVGYHRTTEVTHGAAGWHVHLHVLYLLDDMPGQDRAQASGSALLAGWIKAVRAVGFDATTAGQDFKVLHGDADALAGVAGYVHKHDYHEGPTRRRDARSLALEMARGDLKAARAGGSRTPFGILGSLVALMLEDGTVDGSHDWALWSEWEEASKGRRQQVWSRGLRDLLALGEERSDEEIAADDLGGTDVVEIASEDWREFATRGERVANLLDSMEAAHTPREAAYRARAFLLQYGVPHTLLVE